jgi:predicted lipoprotein with Yx(FWY)xxD motif
MRKTTLRRGAVPAMALGLLALAACGSNSGGSSASANTGSSGDTVTIRDDSGMKVLTTSAGRTLYVSNQEKGKVLCASGACEAIWSPLTVAKGDQPSAPASLSAEIGTVKRPDGSLQVSLQGKPLYTFSFDHSAGQMNGNGQHDSFDGTNFTWHAATPTGSAASGQAPSSSPSSKSGGGPYGY